MAKRVRCGRNRSSSTAMGVLVDSEPIANRVMAEATTGLGWPLTTAGCIARFKAHHLDTVGAATEDRPGRPA